MIVAKRPLLALGAAALMTVSLTACGGGSKASGAPTDASKSDFCSTWNNDKAFKDIGSTDYNAAADAAHEIADKMKSVGTPSDLPSDARAGFEVLVGALSNITSDKIQTGMEAIQKAMASGSSGQDPEKMAEQVFGISASDAPKVTAFTTWASAHC